MACNLGAPFSSLSSCAHAILSSADPVYIAYVWEVISVVACSTLMPRDAVGPAAAATVPLLKFKSRVLKNKSLWSVQSSSSAHWFFPFYVVPNDHWFWCRLRELTGESPVLCRLRHPRSLLACRIDYCFRKESWSAQMLQGRSYLLRMPAGQVRASFLHPFFASKCRMQVLLGSGATCSVKVWLGLNEAADFEGTSETERLLGARGSSFSV